MTKMDDFTEEAFRAMLRELRTACYRFARYGDGAQDRHVIWRHDVDFSMHRAARLAEIEAGEGVVATYFINPRCVYYNLLEPGITRLTARIRDLGHIIGLHFDAEGYCSGRWTQSELNKALGRERRILESIIGAEVTCVSWHNPDISNLLEFDADIVVGMVSAYGETMRRDYAYCSDSNGYWRFRPMMDVISEGHPRLHLLTHPEWWTPEPMPPSARIDRAIQGRARATRQLYDSLLARGGRLNVLA